MERKFENQTRDVSQLRFDKTRSNSSCVSDSVFIQYHVKLEVQRILVCRVLAPQTGGRYQRNSLCYRVGVARAGVQRTDTNRHYPSHVLPLFKPYVQSPRGSTEAPGIADIYWLASSMGCRSIYDLFEPLHPKQANVLVLFIFGIKPVFMDLKINIQSRVFLSCKLKASIFLRC